MSTDGRAEADALIDGLDEPRRSQVRHLHDVILGALPGIDVTVYDDAQRYVRRPARSASTTWAARRARVASCFALAIGSTNPFR